MSIAAEQYALYQQNKERQGGMSPNYPGSKLTSDYPGLTKNSVDKLIENVKVAPNANLGSYRGIFVDMSNGNVTDGKGKPVSAEKSLALYDIMRRVKSKDIEKYQYPLMPAEMIKKLAYGERVEFAPEQSSDCCVQKGS